MPECVVVPEPPGVVGIMFTGTLMSSSWEAGSGTYAGTLVAGSNRRGKVWVYAAATGVAEAARSEVEGSGSIAVSLASGK